MKTLFFKEFVCLYFILVLLTYFLIRRGRHDFISARKLSFLVLAVASAIVSIVFLVYCMFVTHWWMLICLVNLGIVAIIFVDDILLKAVRALLGMSKRQTC